MKLFIIISIILAASFGFDADDTKRVEDGTRILSRKKRFLTFPDGSSFQLVTNANLLGEETPPAQQCHISQPINAETADSKNKGKQAFGHIQNSSTMNLGFKNYWVHYLDVPSHSYIVLFCTQTHGYLQVGDIVWFGHTAALAWELPSDPTIFEMFKDKGKVYSQRRQDNKLLVFLDEDGKVLSTKPYRRKPIVNPAFAKRSISDKNEAKTIKTILINKMHETQKNISTNIFQDLDETTINFHRDGRKSLYDKLYKFFQALGLHGKECVLRMLCESGKAKQNQGTFYEEILRATFTMPRYHKSGLDLHEYDIAHRSEGDCATMYPKCEESSLTL